MVNRQVFKLFLLCTTLTLVGCRSAAIMQNGNIKVQAQEDALQIYYEGNKVQEVSFASGKLNKVEKLPTVHERYAMVTGKRAECTNDAHVRLYHYDNFDMEVRTYHDGVAFRYLNTKQYPQTAYLIEDGKKRWMQRMKNGIDYEGFFPRRTESANGNVAYPALVEYEDGIFGLITEAGLEETHCASCLKEQQGSNRYEVFHPETELHADATPWRVVHVGKLADIVESTLVADLSAPCALSDASWIEPGLSAWIYWANNHGSKDFRIVKEYIDLAAEMHWPYNLIDWEWDEMAHGGNMQDALAYAKSKGVKVTLWYNSGTSWIGPGSPGPIDRLITPEAREREFTMLEELGVSGIKVDFFRDDSREMIKYYIDILRDAARHHLLVDFHGCTIPRGWQRTYPNMVSMEAVYGAEWYNNGPTMTNAAPSHNATLPFTRNVVGPMDYTPCAFTDSQHPHITTSAHELALPVLFESGIQHMADRPSGFLNLPDEVKAFLSSLPAAWDDTRFVDGYPGESAVLARQKDGKWYVAGINGTNERKTLTLNIPFRAKSYTLYSDGTNGKTIEVSHGTMPPKTIDCLPAGGFVLVAE